MNRVFNFAQKAGLAAVLAAGSPLLSFEPPDPAPETRALVLAAAGLRRLGREDRIAAAVPVDVYVPAPGQGIIAVEIREGDDRVQRAVQSIDDADAAVGGCRQTKGGPHPGGGGAELTVRGVVVSPDGARIARASATGVRQDAERLGLSVADELLRGGAGDILADVQRNHAAVEGIQP